ncbi:hypothetical protein ABN254_21665, partial [Providencia rettgeri]
METLEKNQETLQTNQEVIRAELATLNDKMAKISDLLALSLQSTGHGDASASSTAVPTEDSTPP